MESNSTGDTAKSPEDFERPATIYTTMPSHTTLSTIQIKLSQPAKIEHDEDQLSQTSYATSTNHAMRIRVPSKSQHLMVSHLSVHIVLPLEADRIGSMFVAILASKQASETFLKEYIVN